MINGQAPFLEGNGTAVACSKRQKAAGVARYRWGAVGLLNPAGRWQACRSVEFAVCRALVFLLAAVGSIEKTAFWQMAIWVGSTDTTIRR